MKKLFLFVLIVLLFVSASHNVFAVVINTTGVGNDTYIEGDFPNNNFGSQDHITLGHDSFGVPTRKFRGLIRVPLEEMGIGICSNKNVTLTGFNFSYFVLSGHLFGTGNTMNVYALTTGALEMEATWNYNQTGGANWLGAESYYSESNNVSTTVSVIQAHNNLSLNVSWINEMIDCKRPTWLLLKNNAEDTDGNNFIYIGSREVSQAALFSASFDSNFVNTPTFTDPTPANGLITNINHTINVSCSNADKHYLWFDQNTQPSTVKIDNSTTHEWITTIGSDGTYYYTAQCYNSTNGVFSTNSSVRSLILDTSNPTINFNINNFFNSTNNQSTTNQYGNNITFNLTFNDEQALFGYVINITKGSSNFFSKQNLTLSLKQHNFSQEVITTSWGVGVYNINIIFADSHTAHKIKDYDVGGYGGRVDFRTAEGNHIKVSSDGAYNTKSLKLKDRYSFGFDYVFKDNSKVFWLETDNALQYISGSGYKAHFVVWNEKTRSGNWIDFEGLKGDITINKISKNIYRIIFSNTDDSKEVIFNSIGGLNTVEQNYSWYRGKTSATFNSVATISTAQTFVLNVSKKVGYVNVTDAQFYYNGTLKTVSVQNHSDYNIFTSSFTVPATSGNYNISWNVTLNQSNGNKYNISVSDNQMVTLAAINVSIFDENNQSIINSETITVYATLVNTVSQTTTTGNLLISNLSVGSYFLEAEGADYPRRGVYLNVTNQTSYVRMYLVYYTSGNNYINYLVQDTGQQNLEDVRMTFQYLINGSYVTVAQVDTDYAGQARLFQSQQKEYRIILDKAGFPIKTISLLPLLTSYTIYLEQAAQSYYNNVWEGLSYTLTPKSRVLNVSAVPQEFSIDIYADDSSLEYYGLYIDGHNYVCVPASCMVNVSSSPAGGKAIVMMTGNVSGNFDVHYFFKRQGWAVQYIGGTLGSFQVLEALLGHNVATVFYNFSQEYRSPIMKSLIAALVITVLCIIAGSIGLYGIPLVMAAVLGTALFVLVGYINIVVGTIILIVGILCVVLMGLNQ